MGNASERGSRNRFFPGNENPLLNRTLEEQGSGIHIQPRDERGRQRRGLVVGAAMVVFGLINAGCGGGEVQAQSVPLTDVRPTASPAIDIVKQPDKAVTSTSTPALQIVEPKPTQAGTAQPSLFTPTPDATTISIRDKMEKEDEIKKFYLRGEIHDASGERTIKLVGASWTEWDIQLVQKRLEWIRVNDPVLYDHIFEFDGFKKGNLAIGDIGGSCRGALCSWVSEAGNVLITIPNPQKIFIWGDERQSNLISVVALWHEWGRIVADHPSLADEYSLFQGISRSFSSRGDQFAASLGWLAADRIQERLRLSDDDPTVSTLKNGELTFIGLPSNTDLSYLYNDPAVLSTGLTKN